MATLRYRVDLETGEAPVDQEVLDPLDKLVQTEMTEDLAKKELR